MSDTTTSAVSPFLTWLRRSAFVMTLAASAVGVGMAVWFAIVTWRRDDGRPGLFSLEASLIGFALTNLLVAAKIRDGEIRSPVRLVFTFLVCAVLIAMSIRMCLTLSHLWQP